MTETPSPAPPRGQVAPPMPWKLRLSLRVADAVTDVIRRADGTLNRRLLTLLDRRAAASAAPHRGVSSADVTVDASLPLWARVFSPAPEAAPAPAAPLPVIVFFHGGGFAFLSAASAPYDAVCRRIARKARAVVVSVEYRRSPEHRFPAPYEDGFAVLRFLDDPNRAKLLGRPVDVARCFLAGDSAGANIAHHVARRYAAAAATFSSLRLAGIISIQPFFGGEARTDAELRLAGAPIVNTARTDWLWKAFLPAGADRDHEASSPECAGGVAAAEFPPVLLAVGGYDPLQDWQRRYGEALRRAGKSVRLLEYPDAIHAFYVFPEFESSRQLMAEIEQFVHKSES